MVFEIEFKFVEVLNMLTVLSSLFFCCKLFQEEYKDYTFPITVAIVLSGEYEDDVDNSNDVIYTGQGGQNLLGEKRQIKDQEMVHGNLALKVHACYFCALTTTKINW